MSLCWYVPGALCASGIAALWLQPAATVAQFSWWMAIWWPWLRQHSFAERKATVGRRPGTFSCTGKGTGAIRKGFEALGEGCPACVFLNALGYILVTLFFVPAMHSSQALCSPPFIAVLGTCAFLGARIHESTVAQVVAFFQARNASRESRILESRE